MKATGSGSARMDYAKRIALLKKGLASEGLDSLIVTDEANVSYLSGFTGHDSMALITRGRPYFITDSRYIQQAHEESRLFRIELSRGSAYSTITDIVKSLKLKRVGFESMDLPYAVATRLGALLKGAKLKPTTDIVERLREIKEPAEVEAIRGSVRVTRSVFERVIRSIRPGQTEESIACNIETSLLKMFAKAAFEPIVASGHNSSKPHAVPGKTKLRKDSFVMIDLGAKFAGYCSDMTRTLILGAISDSFAKIYSTVREAQRRAIGKIRDGVLASEVDFAARGYIHSLGFGKYFGHSTGHGVGMKVHEAPTVSGSSKIRLRSGMITTVEPAIYIPGFGGVRIEDMVLVTKNGCEILT